MLYFSYEGLKHISSFDFFLQFIRCTFPMRDWNFKIRTYFIQFFLVVLFLWGIETHIITSFLIDTRELRKLYFSYEGLKLVLATISSIILSCTFPMRDWNCSKCKGRILECACCTFPMRDWNKIFWIHRAGIMVVPFLWGIETLCAQLLSLLKKKLYLSYDVLKRHIISCNFVVFFFVVPFLWGIETNHTMAEGT